MRFKSATITDFKRFTNLTVQGIPETARLIMLDRTVAANLLSSMRCILGTNQGQIVDYTGMLTIM